MPARWRNVQRRDVAGAQAFLLLKAPGAKTHDPLVTRLVRLASHEQRRVPGAGDAAHGGFGEAKPRVEAHPVKRVDSREIPAPIWAEVRPACAPSLVGLIKYRHERQVTLRGEDRTSMSIATMTGDTGQTALTGGTRVSKADLRVEAYGTVDELNACLGFARSLCSDKEVRERTEAIQRSLFRVGSALSRPPGDTRVPSALASADVEALTAQVHEIEAIDGILADWSLPGEHRESAAYEIARTVCRRAERCAVRLSQSGEAVQPEAVAYLNRLSDLLWLFGRLIEHRAGIDARLRADSEKGPNWSRAW